MTLYRVIGFYGQEGVGFWEVQQVTGFGSDYLADLLGDMEKVGLLRRREWLALVNGSIVKGEHYVAEGLPRE